MAYFTIFISILFILLRFLGLTTIAYCLVVEDDKSSNILIPQASRNTQDYWVSQAVDFIYQLDCTQNSQFLTKSSCLALTKTSRESINIYIAAPTRTGSRERKYNTVLPDSSLRRSGSHQAVIAIDPFPEANFGHLVIVFYVDRKSESCRGKLEKSMGRECLQIAVKTRCKNRLKTSSKRHCEINMLPLVYKDGDSSFEQQLKCVDSPSYAKCPNYRTGTSNFTNNCELETNTKRCQNQRTNFGRRCKLHETCDYGVMISGGWNRQTSIRRHADNVKNMYAMLRDQGFKKHNIKMFFADNTDIELYETSSQHVDNRYPATQKNAIRNHLSGLCSDGCNADSLIIYLNSPALPDGRSLLWDIDQNGQMDENEMLTVREILEDIANCRAAHVYLIIDQSYSGIFAEEIRRSNDHDNVVVFTSGNKTEYSWRNDLTNAWAHSNHTQQCVDEVYEMYSDTFANSTPRMLEGSMNAANTTVFGGNPCYLLPFMTNKEIRSTFMGCKYRPFG